MLRVGLWPADLTHTPSLFGEGDRVSVDLVAPGSKAFTAAHLEADNATVEVSVHAPPTEAGFPYELHGLGLDDIILVTQAQLVTERDVLAAIHFALQHSRETRQWAEAEAAKEFEG